MLHCFVHTYYSIAAMNDAIYVQTFRNTLCKYKISVTTRKTHDSLQVYPSPSIAIGLIKSFKLAVGGPRRYRVDRSLITNRRRDGG